MDNHKRIIIRLYGGPEDGMEWRADPDATDKTTGSHYEAALSFFLTFLNKGQIGKRFKRIGAGAPHLYEVTSKEETDDEISIICKVVEDEG